MPLQAARSPGVVNPRELAGRLGTVSRPEDGESLGPCPLCGRPMPPDSSDRHHWIPRSQGGSRADWIHRICHTKLHSLFSERELALHYSSPERLLAHDDVARFVKWVRKMPPSYVGKHRPPRR